MNWRIASRTRMHGVSILEFMLSLVIGLVVVGAVLVTYIGSGKTTALQSAQSQMNDDAQIALNILSRDLQLAGYSQATRFVDGKFVRTFVDSATRTAVYGCDTNFDNPNSAGKPNCSVLTVPATTAITSTAVEIVYEADLNNTAKNSAGEPTDCIGNKFNSSELSGALSYTVARNRYFVSSGNSGRPELYCASNAKDSLGAQNPRQPLVENVESIRFWYGLPLVTSPASRQVERYLTASEINAEASPAWNQVLSVRICLLMKSPLPVLNAEDTATYLDCDSIERSSPVESGASLRHLRRAYFTTVTLRNKMDF